MLAPVVGAAVTILGSGSAGNCALLETPQVCLLIDAGLSGRQIAQRLAGIGRTLDDVDAVLLTHEHHDHTQGLPVLCRRHRIPVFASRPTVEYLQEKDMAHVPMAGLWKVFQTGQTFELGDVAIETFPVPHDAQDPVGFLLRHDNFSVGVLTDLGHITRLIVERLKRAQVLLLETNHDVRMLQDDLRRPWSLKQRILSRFGHLSNEAAAEAAAQLVHDGLHHIFLSHLSRDCNRPELARAAVAGALDKLGARHVSIHVASQDAPSPTLALGVPRAEQVQPSPCMAA
ncbi:MAG: MBL fold metallo-hydrolase [Verrucomicrobia bacterium]|nr:MBL fold metallo-hydrolase [Verrucomicrobiota bacterium]